MKRFYLLFLTLPCFATIGTPTISTNLSCGTVSSCSVTIPSSAPGHGGVLVGTSTSQNITPTAITGASTGTSNASTPYAWYYWLGGGAQANKKCSATDANSGSIWCATIYSTTAGSTSIAVTLSGTAANVKLFYIDFSYSNGPIAIDVNPIGLDQTPAGTTTSGPTLNLTGSNDLLVHAIIGQNNISSIDTGYTATTSGTSAIAYLNNTTTTTVPTWTQSTSPAHGAVIAISIAEAAGVVSGIRTQWQAANRTQVGGQGCYKQSAFSVSADILHINTSLTTNSCESIDRAYASQSYLSGSLNVRSVAFQYGTVEFRAKLGGANNVGNWAIFQMFDALEQLSYPTATDNNDLSQGTFEFDIAEFTGSTTTPNQQVHMNGHNDNCVPTISDATQNFHVYDFVWESGDAKWYIDGVQTCHLSGTYIAAVPMFFFIDINTGYNGGPVTNGSLPWDTQVDYVRICPSGTGASCSAAAATVFDDEFNPISTTVAKSASGKGGIAAGKGVN